MLFQKKIEAEKAFMKMQNETIKIQRSHDFETDYHDRMTHYEWR